MDTVVAPCRRGRSYPRPPDPVPAVLGRPTGSGAVLACRTPDCQRQPDAHHAYCRDHTERLLLRALRGGQALAEFALVLPILLFLVLATVESGMLVAQKGTQDRHTATLAQVVADHPDDDPAPAVDALLPGCEVTVEFQEDPDLVWALSTCQYAPIATRGLWDGLPISSSESAAMDPTASAAR